MAFRASLSVFLGCQFGQANKLLSAAERGEDTQVKQVLVSKPQLAAFTGFHGTTSPLHRAAGAGHLSTCKAIVEMIKSKIIETEQAVNSGKQRSSTLKRWKSLLTTVIDQRSHLGQTPLMLACEAGHASITAFLLAEGADPLATDMFHSRTALHYAAAGGHSQCVKLLCSDSIYVNVDGTRRLLRDVITDDLQVHSAKFIDQRSSGGLTALHFAAVSGDLDSLQALLRAGAAIMVKTNAEAFIGQEYLTSGSTPLHIAVIVDSIPIAHALLQAHAEMMTVISLGRNERHRRLWEGHSRSDIRSVRNSAKKLPYHLARDKAWTQMMHLIDPRISVDAALDAARDTDHGIGPKNLATICSLVLQTSLLQWLDQTETEIEEKEKEKSESEQEEQTFAGKPEKHQRPAATAAACLSSPFAGEVVRGANDDENLDTMANSSPMTTAPSMPLLFTASAPAIPALSMQSMGSLHTYLGMLCTRRLSPFDLDSPLQKQQTSQQEETAADIQQNGFSRLSRHQRSATLGYGDLTRLTPLAATAAAVAPPTASPSRTSSFSLRNRGLPRASSTGNLGRALGSLQLPFSSPTPTDGNIFINVRTSGGCPGIGSGIADSLVANMTSIGSDDDGTCIQDHLHHHPYLEEQPQQQGGGAATAPGTMRRVLSSLREKLKSSDGSSSSGAEGDSAPDLTSYVENTTENIPEGAVLDSNSQECMATATTTVSATTTLSGSSSSAASSAASDEYTCTSGGCDTECGVCLDHGVQVAFAGCEHALCLQCARNLTKQEKKPPSCPFCRRMVVGFLKVQSIPNELRLTTTG